MILKLHGKPFNPKPPSPQLAKLVAYLDKCPADEIYEHKEISQKLGFNADYAKDRASSISAYTAIVGRRRYVGHPKAIAELKRQCEGL